MAESRYLQGTAQLTRQLRALGKLENGKALRAAVNAGVQPVKAVAKGLIPEGVDAHRTYKGRVVAPGFAKRNIATKTKLSRDKQKAVGLVGVKPEAFYAVQFVEVGTSKMAAQPWLRPAFDATIKDQQQAMALSLKKSIQKASRTR